MKTGAFAALVMTSWLMTSHCVSGTTKRTVHIREDAFPGQQIGNVEALLHLLPTDHPRYQLLNQRLITSAAAPQRRRWIGVDERTGTITLLHRVVRNRVCGDSETCLVRAQIYVKVTGMQKMLDLDVIIDDVNDNDPTFPVRLIVVNISESADLGDVISLDRFMASDRDQGNNSRITYSVSRNGYFVVEQFTDDMGSHHLQLVVKKHLDFENSSSEEFLLTAEDGGNPKRESSARVRVEIIDANDNKPIFEKAQYLVELNENVRPRSIMTHVTAKDADSGPAGDIRYSLSKHNKPIARHLVSVDPETGGVSLKQKLDREKHDGIRIRIEARDSGSTNQNTGGTWLVLRVIDTNDNEPQIWISLIPPGEGTVAYISEDAKPGTAFAYVTATDEDLGHNADVTIEIESVTPSGGGVGLEKAWMERFELDAAGLLGIATSLNREEKGRYEILLKACDNGTPKLCSNKSLELLVLDVNDNSPTFEEDNLVIRLREDEPVGSLVVTLNATDGDATNLPSYTRIESGKVVTSSNGDVTYSIVNSDGSFAIEPRSGKMTLVRPLDREQRDSFELTVEAKDGGRPHPRSATCHVTIHVDDVNDNHPVFTNPPEDNMTVHATTVREAVVLRLQTMDDDADKNAEVTYSLASVSGEDGDMSRLFIIDSNNGDLRLNTSIDELESFLGPYYITVHANDHGAPPLSSRRHIHVIVTDRDVPPTLVAPAKKGGISHILIIIILASSLVILTVVVVVAFLRCRKFSKESRTYKCHKVAQDDNEWGRASVSSLKQKPIEARRAVSKETDIEEAERLWEDSNKTRTDSIVTASNTDITNTSRHDVMMTRQFRSSTRSLGRGPSQCSNHSTRPLVPEKYQSVPHLLTASSHDGDSGRGDSDPDVASCEANCDPEFPRLRSNSHLSVKSDASERSTNHLSRRCTDMCLKYGHSDTCWMPPTPRVAAPPYSSPAYIDNKNSMYVQLCPLPQNGLVPYPDQQRLSDLEPIPESTPLRYFAAGYPASDLSSIYSNVIAANRVPPPHGYYSPMRPVHDVTPRVTSFDHQTPTSSRLSPISSVSSPPPSSLTFDEQQRKNHYVVRRDVAPDDVACTSPGSVPASPKRPTNNLARSYSADLLSTDTSGAAALGSPRIRVQSPAASEQNYRSNAYGNVSMRETEEIVQNIEKLLNT